MPRFIHFREWAKQSCKGAIVNNFVSWLCRHHLLFMTLDPYILLFLHIIINRSISVEEKPEGSMSKHLTSLPQHSQGFSTTKG